MDPKHITTRMTLLKLGEEVSHKTNTKAADSLTRKWEDLPYNEQVDRFVLLYFLMKQAGLCKGEVRNFLSKYLYTLSDNDFRLLKFHFPHVGLLHKKDFDFELSLEGIQRLGPKTGLWRNIPTIVIEKALNLARVRASCDPLAFYGVDDGWFLWLASDLSQRSIFIHGANGRVFSHKREGFWFGELENAVWLGIVSRLALLAPHDEYLDTHRSATRDAWRAFFGDFSSNNRSCTCQDRKKALPDEDYSIQIKPRDSKNIAKLEGRLVKVLRALDTFGSPELSTEQCGSFDVSELYTTTADSAFPVYKRVFDLHYNAQLWEVLNKLPGLAESVCLEIAKRHISDLGTFSTFIPTESETSQPQNNAKVNSPAKPVTHQPKKDPKVATSAKPVASQPKKNTAAFKVTIPVESIDDKNKLPDEGGQWTTVTYKPLRARRHRTGAHR